VWAVPSVAPFSICVFMLGPPRPLRQLPSKRPRVVPTSTVAARLSLEGSHLPSYDLCTCVARHRTCINSCYFCYVRLPSGAGACHSIWLAAPRGTVDIYAHCILVPFDYCRSCASSSGQSHLCHPFTYGSPASPFLPCKANSSILVQCRTVLPGSW
jgi:hypothetical protein